MKGRCCEAEGKDPLSRGRGKAWPNQWALWSNYYLSELSVLSQARKPCCPAQSPNVGCLGITMGIAALGS